MNRIARFLSIALLFATSLSAQVSVGGVGYGQYVYQLSSPNGFNAFDVTRSYVNVQGKFLGGVSTRITSDIYRQAGDGSLRYRLKYAFVAYTPEGSTLTYKFGQIHTPFIDWEEALWDYRMQGQMATERGGYLSSSDFGFGVDGKWKSDRVNLQVGVYNGENYNGGTGDQHKDFMSRASVRVIGTSDSSKVGGLRVTGYAQVGEPTGGGVRNRFLGMVSYKSNHLTLATEYATTKDEVKGTVTSGFIVYRPSRIAFIGRVDITDPNTAVGKNTRFIAGSSYQVTNNLRVLVDLDQISYDGTISAAQKAARSQVFGQIQFTF